MGDAADDAERAADREREEGEPITAAAREAVEALLDSGPAGGGELTMARVIVGPVEQTERAAEDSAIRFLLDGLEVGSLAELKQLVDAGRARGYRDGFADGIAAYAWWDSGTQFVGTTGRTLADALARVEETWNYLP